MAVFRWASINSNKKSHEELILSYIVDRCTKATLVQREPRFFNNVWFSEDPKILRDNQNSCFAELRRQAARIGIDLSTEDLNSAYLSKLVLFVDLPRKKYTKLAFQTWYLFLNEPPCVYEKNWQNEYHSAFDRVFTWNEDVVDNKKYFLLRLAYDLNYNFTIGDFHKRQFLTMIAGAKYSRYSGSLYGERIELIKWFSEYHPGDLDHYGGGWPRSLRPLLVTRIEKRLPGFVKRGLDVFFPLNISYKGPISQKRQILSNYRFSICYENMQGLKGFVTEKIFDSFCSGCVPIYWGAENIRELIPEVCFIDRRNYKSYDDLYEYLRSVTPDEFRKYQSNIVDFLKSEKCTPFSPAAFAGTLMEYVLRDL